MARIVYTNSEPLTVEIAGQEYIGTLTTKGAQEVRMTVEYNGREVFGRPDLGNERTRAA